MRGVWATWGSGEPPPRGWRVAPVAIVALLLLAAPWSDAAGGMRFAAPVLLLAVLGACHELLAGRGGAWVFTLGLQASLGGLGVALAAEAFGGGLPALAVGLAGALATALAIDLLLAAATWRVGRAVAGLASLAAAILLPLLTAGVPGLADARAIVGMLPAGFADGSPLLRERLAYGVLAIVATLLWLVLLRFANSPFGRVLPALRDDPRLAEVLGYRPALHRAMASGLATLVAVPAGAAIALWQGASGPLVAGSLDFALQTLLVGLVAGFGSLWGAPVGAAVVLAAWRWLPDLLIVAAGRVPDLPWLVALLVEPASQRWVMAAIVAAAGWAVGGLMARRP